MLDRIPARVPRALESHSLVSTSSDSHRRKSIGFSMVSTRSLSGFRRTILRAGAMAFGMRVVCRGVRVEVFVAKTSRGGGGPALFGTIAPVTKRARGCLSGC